MRQEANTSNRRAQPAGSSSESLMWVGLMFTGLACLGVLYAVVHLGHKLENTGAVVPADPFALLLELVKGRLAWPGTSTWLLVAAAAVLLAVLVLWIVAGRKRAKARSRVDHAAQYLGAGRDIETLSEANARKFGERFGIEGPVGVVVGETITRGKKGQRLFSSWEDMLLLIAGPRTGKSTSYAIPAMVEAPGAVVATSNKRDLVDATRGPRAEVGKVFVFDPQRIALEEPSWWWNPLSYVTDEVKAAKMAEHFAAGSREAGAKTDAYFDGAGKDLLAGLLLAAALDGRPITQVYTWLTRPTDDRPVEILRDHDVPMIADQVAGVIMAPDKQRGGVYGTAQKMAACLTNRQIQAWICRQGEDDTRPQFDPEEFVKSTGTLYSLSKEGAGTAGPLVTALTVATIEAAEELAARSPGGRLKQPMLGVLDEAANVCRWNDLPSLYSHFGSRGIILLTILQSWSQGVEVWGDSGMKKLWSASNVKMYAGGVSEEGFLKSLSELVGDYDMVARSASVSDGKRSTSTSIQQRRIFDVAELAAMPKGRAVVLASGSRPVLVRTVPWMVGPHADAVKASIARFDPQGQATIGQAVESLHDVAEAEAEREEAER